MNRSSDFIEKKTKIKSPDVIVLVSVPKDAKAPEKTMAENIGDEMKLHLENLGSIQNFNTNNTTTKTKVLKKDDSKKRKMELANTNTHPPEIFKSSTYFKGLEKLNISNVKVVLEIHVTLTKTDGNMIDFYSNYTDKVFKTHHLIDLAFLPEFIVHSLPDDSFLKYLTTFKANQGFGTDTLFLRVAINRKFLPYVSQVLKDALLHAFAKMIEIFLAKQQNVRKEKMILPKRFHNQISLLKMHLTGVAEWEKNLSEIFLPGFSYENRRRKFSVKFQFTNQAADITTDGLNLIDEPDFSKSFIKDMLSFSPVDATRATLQGNHGQTVYFSGFKTFSEYENPPKAMKNVPVFGKIGTIYKEGSNTISFDVIEDLIYRHVTDLFLHFKITPHVIGTYQHFYYDDILDQSNAILAVKESSPTPGIFVLQSNVSNNIMVKQTPLYERFLTCNERSLGIPMSALNKSNVSMLSEFLPISFAETLDKFVNFEEGSQHENLVISLWWGILWQIVYTLRNFESTKLSHHDTALRNILLCPTFPTKSGKPEQYLYHYDENNMHVYAEMESPFCIRIFDFNLASKEQSDGHPQIRNREIELGFCEKSGICSEFKKNFDWYMFCRELYDRKTSYEIGVRTKDEFALNAGLNIPKEIMSFILGTCFPKHNNMSVLTKDKLRETRPCEIKPKDEEKCTILGDLEDETKVLPLSRVQKLIIEKAKRHKSTVIVQKSLPTKSLEFIQERFVKNVESNIFYDYNIFPQAGLPIHLLYA